MKKTRGFCKNDLNKKANAKLTMLFQNFHLSYSSHNSDYLWKCHYFFYFWKCMFYSIILIFLFYLQYCHFHQYTSHYEQPISSYKFTKNRHLHLHISYTHKPFSFHFISYLIPKSQLFISKILSLLELFFFFCELIRVIQLNNSWSRTSG